MSLFLSVFISQGKLCMYATVYKVELGLLHTCCKLYCTFDQIVGDATIRAAPSLITLFPVTKQSLKGYPWIFITYLYFSLPLKSLSHTHVILLSVTGKITTESIICRQRYETSQQINSQNVYVSVKEKRMAWSFEQETTWQFLRYALSPVTKVYITGLKSDFFPTSFFSVSTWKNKTKQNKTQTQTITTNYCLCVQIDWKKYSTHYSTQTLGIFQCSIAELK